MGALALPKLHVLITGVDASISRDAARLLASHGACVTGVDADVKALARLDRDVSLYGAAIETAPINLASATSIRMFEDHLRLTGKLPHVMICCCARRDGHCAGLLAAQILQPSLFLQLAPGRRDPISRALRSLKHPTLLSLLARKPGHGIFDPDQAVGRVRIAGQTYILHRGSETPRNVTETTVKAFSPPPRRRAQAPADALHQPGSPRANAA